MTTQASPPVAGRASRPLFAPRAPDDLSSHIHRQSIGALGAALPVLLWIIAAWRITGGLPQWRPWSSVSSYYYSGAVAVFAGVLFALAVFLFTYQGFDNAHRRRDRIAAVIAGVAAVLVACFPTAAPDVLPAPAWWTPVVGAIHYVSATILFGSFIFFSLFLFPMSSPRPGEPPSPGKPVRNRIYIACGVAMVLCVVWVVVASFLHWPIFWPEALALEFFAFSWLVKGRADWTAGTAYWRTLHYGRHPGQLVRKAWGSIRS